MNKPLSQRISAAVIDLFREACQVSWILFKIMIPVIIVVKLLTVSGAIHYVGLALSPLMNLVGVPGEMGLVWATTMLVNLYGALVVFVALLPDTPVTVGQVTILASMMLIAHALPVELGITRKAGSYLLPMGLIRCGGALLYGCLLNLYFRVTGTGQGVPNILLTPAAEDPSLGVWVQSELLNLGSIFLILLALLTLIRLLRWLKVTDWLERILSPVLTCLGMSPLVAEMTVVGMTLGLSFGGGIIIHRANEGRIPARDVFLSLVLMSLCHGLIEDTLLMLAMGGHVAGILLGRLLFGLVFTYALVRLLALLAPANVERYLYQTREPKETEKSERFMVSP
ncbi:MAG: hypothetical protein IIC50_05660 [Planctomycetes bacterium]|nr:hypothetical protein [Planctomycetota bacterium]